MTITKISIELCQYFDEVGIKHKFWIGKIFESELTQKNLCIQSGPFDTFQEAMRGINAQIIDRTILKQEAFMLHIPSVPEHFNCRCLIIKKESQ